MFGTVAPEVEGLEEEQDDDFEDSYWNGSEWIDGPAPPGQQ